ncbi:MAG: regulatory protein GemA [Micavibrio aeruginosavorus]|uniref:Regulatory protein GemA n=1 Tax=Micavibrio aeruginosavorus TaxID=349221 RepID=A0A2W5MYQ4_9BACT|nr:MAG: regulatory protein GemA [Micavibrio aeruginosavorus]
MPYILRKKIMTKFSKRNGLIAKIHVAKKELCLTDDCYRDFLRGITGKESCTQMSEEQLDAVVSGFKRLGFADKKTPKRAGNRKLASQPQAKMIRGLWITLHQMGEVDDPSEAALAKFVEKRTKVSDLHWITPADADIVIKALKGWVQRVEDSNEG